MGEAKAPGVIIKHRASEGTLVHSDRIDRYWRSRKDGSKVMVMRYMRVANENKKRVVFVSESMPTREVSCDYHEFVRDFEPAGNSSDRF